MRTRFGILCFVPYAPDQGRSHVVHVPACYFAGDPHALFVQSLCARFRACGHLQPCVNVADLICLFTMHLLRHVVNHGEACCPA